VARKRYKQNRKFDVMAKRLFTFWHPGKGGFESLKGKEKDFWRALAETHQGFDRVLDDPKSWEYVNEKLEQEKFAC
jgi:hypothetical protein